MEEKIQVYIGRDEDGDLGMYANMPRRKTTVFHHGYWRDGPSWLPLDSEMFPELKWSDGPMEVELIIKKK